MNITELLDPKSIFIPLDAPDKNSCIRAMIDGLAASGVITDRAKYEETVLNREKVGSTGIGFGVAIPHGKSAGAAKAGLAFAKLSEPLDWQSIDGNPVSAVIMIAVPEEAAGNEHLQILIAISRKLIDEDFRSALLGVSDAEELMQVLKSIG